MARWQTLLTQYSWLRRLAEWGFLFLVLLLAILAATQQRETPQLVLLLFLYVITIHFSLPAHVGSLGLMPVVALCSLLMSDLLTAVILLTLGLIFSELIRPLWHPIWENVNLPQPGRWQRLGITLRQLLALCAAAWLTRQFGSTIPLNHTDLAGFAVLTASHAVAFFAGSLLLWWGLRQPWPTFWREASLGVVADGLLTPPFAILGSLIFLGSGMPVFVIFCLGVMIVSMLLWVAWQRQYTLTQHITQFAALNSVGTSLRETLDLPTVIERTQQQVNDLILADQFTLWLHDEQGGWQNAASVGEKRPFSPSDFTQWVADHGRILELNSRNLIFAPRHGLAIPQPPPQAWLGVPLTTAERLIGVMVLQRGRGGQRFSRWSRELFVAIANQASAAIQNARLYGETVRLYNLTDEALAQRLRQLQALLNSIQEGVLMVDRHGRVVLLNPMALSLLDSRLQPGDQLPPAAAARLGYREAELGQLGQRLTAVSTPPTLPETAVVYQTTLGTATRAIERSEAPVLSEDGQLLGWLMLFRDVTAAHELAERRTDLTRMIVHDLRNPITTILSNLNLATSQLSAPENVAEDSNPRSLAFPERGLESSATNLLLGQATPLQTQELLDDARQACHDMLDMVDSLMDINRMEAGQAVIDPDAMNLGRLAQTVVERLQPLAQRQNITLRLEVETAVSPVWADEEMVRRVLVNLLDNALKFTPAGGEVVCRVEPDTTDGAAAETHEPGTRCLINDTGPGIPAAARELIFDRYMRTNQGGAQVRGTGLGLTFCKMTINAHNGRIWAEESANGGSCFIFTLPGIPVFSKR